MSIKKIVVFFRMIFSFRKKKAIFNKILDETKDTRLFVKTWLTGFESLSDIAVKAREVEETLDWQEEVLTNTPEKAKVFFNETMYNEFIVQKNAIKKILPDFQLNTSVSIATIMSTTAVSSSLIVQPSHNLVISLTGSKNSEVQSWASDGTKSYSVLQAKFDRFQEIDTMLGKLPYDIKKEFGFSDIYKFDLSKAEERINIGIKMRNVVEELHGDMLECARKTKKMVGKDWIKMADLICIDLPGSVAHTQLVKEEGTYKTLWADLTTLTKSVNSGFNEQDVKNIYSKYIDFLYSILNLVKF